MQDAVDKIVDKYIKICMVKTQLFQPYTDNHTKFFENLFKIITMIQWYWDNEGRICLHTCLNVVIK